MNDNFFFPLNHTFLSDRLPAKLIFHPESLSNPWVVAAVEDLQKYLQIQNEWKHNFGLNDAEDSAVVGKMFGILIVETECKRIGYLSSFSGKLAGRNQHIHFVPPVFDGLTEENFVTTGMQHLSAISLEIALLQENHSLKNSEEIEFLKAERREHSVKLQNEIFDRYIFLNHSGQEKKMRAIFQEAGYKNPPSGAGECAAPKLLQFAFQNKMKPLAIAEFWWGLSPKSETWKHGEFYPSCKEKCEPILKFMLS